MTDKTQARCTCAEVLGEDPDCTLHGVETSWALEHTLPSEWQTQVIELRQMLNEARISHSLPGDVGMRRQTIFRELRAEMPVVSAHRLADAIMAALTPSALSGDAGEGRLQSALAKRTSMSTVTGGGKRPHVEIRFANLADAHALTDAVLGRMPAGNDKIETSMTVQEAWAANKKLVSSPTAVEDGDGLLYEPEGSDIEKEREAYRLGYDHAMSGFPALVGPRIAAALTPSPLSDLQRLGQEYDGASALSGDAGEGE